MRDYYKILGVKKNAPEEEIREHWVQLMRKLHPDQRMEEAMEDERIKEINEAYQVLKHSSTRVEYDLKRAYDQGKRGSYFQKLSMPVSILIVLVILGTVYLKKTQITIQPALVTQDTINQINQKNQIDQINQANQTNQINERNQRNLSRLPRSESVQGEMQSLFHRDQKNQINQKDQIDKKGEREPTEQIPASTHSRILASTHPRIDPMASTTRKPKRPNVLNDLTINTSTHPRIDHTIVSTPQQPERSNVLNDNNDLTINASTHVRIDGSTPPPIDASNPIVSATQQSKRSNVHNDNNDLNVIRIAASTHQPIAASTHSRIDASTPLIATEDEVRQFFANYTERYIQKDLDGFLSLFSPRAVQNHRDGLEGIRKIYGNFLKQSQEIEYHIDDIKIEIYQNAAEIKARYELVQLLKKSGEKKIWRGDIRWILVKEGGALKILSLDYQPQRSY